MTKKSKADQTAKFTVNINDIYSGRFKNRNTAIRYLVKNFTDNIDFISTSDRILSVKHSPWSNFFLTEQCSKELIRTGGAL